MKSVTELTERREKVRKGMFIRNDHHKGIKVVVAMGECGIDTGARAVLTAITEEVEKQGLEAQVTLSGCRGECGVEPMFDVLLPGKDKSTYTKMTPEKAREIIQSLPKGS